MQKGSRSGIIFVREGSRLKAVVRDRVPNVEILRAANAQAGGIREPFRVPSRTNAAIRLDGEKERGVVFG